MIIRPHGSGTTSGMIQIIDADNSNKLKMIKRVVSDGSDWTKVEFVFCIPPNTKAITISLYRTAGTDIDWDDVSIKKI